MACIQRDILLQFLTSRILNFCYHKCNLLITENEKMQLSKPYIYRSIELLRPATKYTLPYDKQKSTITATADLGTIEKSYSIITLITMWHYPLYYAGILALML
jgi:hypothetical protein